MSSYVEHPTVLNSGALIDGKWIEGSAGTFDVVSPHSGNTLHQVGKCSPADADLAMASAQAAQADWANTPVVVLAKILRRIQQLMLERSEAKQFVT